MSETQEVEVLVGRGAEGEVYAIPVEMLELFRVPGEYAAELIDDDEVSGYGANFGGGQIHWGPAKPWNPPVAPRPWHSIGFKPSGNHIWAR